MNRFAHVFLAGSLLSVATLATTSVHASAATDCAATAAEGRGLVAVGCLADALPAYPPNPGGSTDPSTTTTTTTTVGLPVGGGSGAGTPTPGSGSNGAAATTGSGSGPSTNVAGVSLSAPTTAVPAAAPAIAPTGEVAASPISFTGAQSTLLAGIAAALTATGALFVVVGRRRRATTPRN